MPDKPEDVVVYFNCSDVVFQSLCGTCRRCGGGKGRLAAPRKRVTLRGKKKSKHFAHNNIGSVPEVCAELVKI